MHTYKGVGRALDPGRGRNGGKELVGTSEKQERDRRDAHAYLHPRLSISAETREREIGRERNELNGGSIK